MFVFKGIMYKLEERVVEIKETRSCLYRNATIFHSRQFPVLNKFCDEIERYKDIKSTLYRDILRLAGNTSK